MSGRTTILCLASYYKGGDFIRAAKRHGATVYLLTIEDLLTEAWPRDHLDEVFALKNFHAWPDVVKAVAFLLRSKKIDRVVALDDFDVELAGHLRDYFRLPGLSGSAALLFRDKLAMRTRAAELGVRVPEFTAVFHDADVAHFLANVPGPWLLKPRSQASAAGITKFHDPAAVWPRLRELGDDRANYLLERMVPGDVFHVDSLVVDQQVVFAEANGYLRPLLEVYHQGGIYATRTLPRDQPEVAALRAENAKVLIGFGLGYGASHTEFLKSSADGQFYFIETSARVGGANTAEMVAAASGVNLWSEWAKLEAAVHPTYLPPPPQQRYAGVVVSLARFERPDTSSFTDPEIVYRLDLKNHIGFVVAADSPVRVQQLLADYTARIARDFHAVLPPAEKVSH